MTDHDKLREAIKHMREDQGVRWCERCQLVADAAEAHLATLPKTKMVETWRSHWTWRGQTGAWQSHPTPEAAARDLRSMARQPETYSELKITGPHQQEVPA